MPCTGMDMVNMIARPWGREYS